MGNRVDRGVDREMDICEIQDRTWLTIRTRRSGLAGGQRGCNPNIVPIDYRVLRRPGIVS
jgi:hypothetical protein